MEFELDFSEFLSLNTLDFSEPSLRYSTFLKFFVLKSSLNTEAGP